MKYEEVLKVMDKDTLQLFVHVWDASKQPLITTYGYCEIEDAKRDAKALNIEHYEVMQVRLTDVLEMIVVIAAPLRRESDVFLAK